MQRLLLGLVGVLAMAEPVAARPPPPPLEVASDPKPVLVQWTSWVRGAIAVASGESNDAVPRAIVPPVRENERSVAGAVGVGFTLPLGHRVRFGPWAELRGWNAPFIGGELTLIAGDLRMFFWPGKSAITARAGASPDQLTAQLGIAYRAQWDLETTSRSRYMIGVGLVATATQSRFDPHDWSATVGLEFEPVGALRYLLGIESWY